MLEERLVSKGLSYTTGAAVWFDPRQTFYRHGRVAISYFFTAPRPDKFEPAGAVLIRGRPRSVKVAQLIIIHDLLEQARAGSEIVQRSICKLRARTEKSRCTFCPVRRISNPSGRDWTDWKSVPRDPYFRTTQIFWKRTGSPWFCSINGPLPGNSRAAPPGVLSFSSNLS